MSLRVLTSRFLAITPKCWMKNGKFYSRSHLGLAVCGLGLYWKRVVVDPEAQVVQVSRRLGWFFTKRREISFREVLRIDYVCESIPTSFDLFFGVTNEFDRFRVGLELKDRWVYRLWTFYGEGSVQTGWAGTLLGGDEFVDLAGDQEDASERFTRVLSVMMEKPLG